MFTRDNPLWNWLMGIGALLLPATLLISNPADYGLTPVQLKWLQLLAGALLASGKNGTSKLPHSIYGHAKAPEIGR